MAEKSPIIFHEKQMSILEAKLYVLGLNLMLIRPDLSEEEIIEYVNLKERERERGVMVTNLLGKKYSKEIIKQLSERKYLINTLERRIETEQKLRKKEYCEKHGHKKGISYTSFSIENSGNQYLCSRCGFVYTKE